MIYQPVLTICASFFIFHAVFAIANTIKLARGTVFAPFSIPLLRSSIFVGVSGPVVFNGNDRSSSRYLVVGITNASAVLLASDASNIAETWSNRNWENYVSIGAASNVVNIDTKSLASLGCPGGSVPVAVKSSYKCKPCPAGYYALSSSCPNCTFSKSIAICAPCSAAAICPLGSPRPLPASARALFFQYDLFKSLELTPVNLGMNYPMTTSELGGVIGGVFSASVLFSIACLILRKYFRKLNSCLVGIDRFNRDHYTEPTEIVVYRGNGASSTNLYLLLLLGAL